tara:strand:+ start:40 stop:402 length:363 start_codon:yes stop_codon:yes gene_type:complete
MANYVANGEKQTAGSLPDNAYDSLKSPAAFTSIKSPNYIIVTADISADLGLHFNPNTFSVSATAEKPGDTTIYSGSAGYDEFNTLKAGQYNLHPIAVSGSAADVAKIKFVYKSGLSTGGF